MTTTFTGSCLCGAVRFEAKGEPGIVGHCHCVDCRKSSGTGHCTHAMMPEDAVTIEGATTRFDKPADSGNMVSRHFCGTCGAPVYSTNSGMPGMIFLRASSLDDPDILTPGMIVYAGRAPGWDTMDDSLPAFETMPPDRPDLAI